MDVFSWFLCIWDITCVVHCVSRLLEKQGEIYSLSREEKTLMHQFLVQSAVMW